MNIGFAKFSLPSISDFNLNLPHIHLTCVLRKLAPKDF